jgi:hypothetical protein
MLAGDDADGQVLSALDEEDARASANGEEYNGLEKLAEISPRENVAAAVANGSPRPYWNGRWS